MTTHALKIKPQWFERIANLEKTAEIRQHDRDYQAGDEIQLWETGDYDRKTGRYLTAEIRHVLPAAQFPEGLIPGCCLLSLGLISDVLHENDSESQS